MWVKMSLLQNSKPEIAQPAASVALLSLTLLAKTLSIMHVIEKPLTASEAWREVKQSLILLVLQGAQMNKENGLLF